MKPIKINKDEARAVLRARSEAFWFANHLMYPGEHKVFAALGGSAILCTTTGQSGARAWYRLALNRAGALIVVRLPEAEARAADHDCARGARPYSEAVWEAASA
jgi:hypothetical protein